MKCQHETSVILWESETLVLEYCTWGCNQLFVVAKHDDYKDGETRKCKPSKVAIKPCTPPGYGWLARWRYCGSDYEVRIEYGDYIPQWLLCAAPIGPGSNNVKPQGARCTNRAAQDGKCLRHLGYRAVEWEFCPNCNQYKQVKLPCVWCKS